MYVAIGWKLQNWLEYSFRSLVVQYHGQTQVWPLTLRPWPCNLIHWNSDESGLLTLSWPELCNLEVKERYNLAGICHLDYFLYRDIKLHHVCWYVHVVFSETVLHIFCQRCPNKNILVSKRCPIKFWYPWIFSLVYLHQYWASWGYFCYFGLNKFFRYS